ncbi:ABC transporter ATP-binding protein [Lutispora thermophila]|uniref:Iron complex transport system ATP-binding protein n=1 Tax=Lutispora thermophila DSM 19022 TaxID=1122184 RepID=A0A1M6H9K2_9FIRM|nr:ABC transporter ATP-binding protein [Lutispora thermophila]SHJ18908.1 iron complex transport system ATP-binding protein [Lutispora thermophila DSM 19022]
MYFGFKDISINYGKREIIKDVTIEFPKGKTTTIIGPNGSGKTSLLKVISRAVTPVRGEVVFNGKPLKQYKLKELAKKIAYLPQVHNSPSDIDVRTLVSYGRYPYKQFGRGLTRYDNDIIDNTIEITGLKNLQNRLVETLSGGERQRAWIAMTICQQPEVLVLDEPITYLDIGFQLEVMELIKKLGEEMQLTIIMVLHDINFASRYSHYLLSIKDKGVYSYGDPRKIITSGKLEDIFGIQSQIFEDEKNNCPFIIPEKKRSKWLTLGN